MQRQHFSNRKTRIVLLLLGVIASFTLMAHVHGVEVSFYVGTYTKPEGSKGIYHYRMDLETGAVSGGELAVEMSNPSFLAVHPRGAFLYAVSESGGTGAVSAFGIEPDGKLKLLNEQPAKGAGPCHISVDPSGKVALVANYGSGSIVAFPIESNGSLSEAAGFAQHTGSGPNSQRQKGPHAHAIYPDSTGTRAYVCDLGIDKVLLYDLDPKTAALTAHTPPFASLAPGSGPRHLAFHPKGAFVYVINELLNTIVTFSHDPGTGRLTEMQTVSTLPADFTGSNTTAEIFVHPNGKFVYGSNRGHDSIAVFAVGADGKLTFVEHAPTLGKGPRSFAIDPSGKWLLAANQKTDNIVVFKIDPVTGKLTPAGTSLRCAAPVCVMFAPAK